MKLLPTEIIKSIWSAAAPGSVPSERQVEVAHEWLARVFETAERSATRDEKVPLTRKDVDRLESAYNRFRAVLTSLQDRDYPPPMMPIKDGITDWEYWIGSNNFKFKRGRDTEYDWTMIGSLLELYEAITGRRASGAGTGGRTLRFLEAAIEAFAGVADPLIGSYFRSPSADALRRKILELRSMWNDSSGLRLKKLRGLEGE